MKSFQIEFKSSSIKELHRLPKKVQSKILEAVDLLSTNPFSSLLPIRKLHGESRRDLYRMRVQDYRIIYEIEKDRVIIFVIRIGHRKDVYR